MPLIVQRLVSREMSAHFANNQRKLYSDTSKKLLRVDIESWVAFAPAGEMAVVTADSWLDLGRIVADKAEVVVEDIVDTENLLAVGLKED